MVLKDNFSLLRHVSITENTTKTNIKFKENDKVFFSRITAKTVYAQT